MKKLCILFVLCFLFTACSTVKDDMPVQLLAMAVGEKIEGFDNLSEASTDYIKYCMTSDLSIYSEYIVMYPFAGSQYNEFGIFKVRDKNNLQSGVKEVENYISFKKSNWDTRYMGEEFKKIDNAKVTVCGHYILYTILSENESKSAARKFENMLKR
ncbi:MAG: DUF4358 domain-containing protein [Ruminococcaceae bacterium]|nr:DUF4358 domain-containing protein [Oscillospiraceae bacterium]